MSHARPCPECQRPNAAHRAACMYCGSALPDPAAPPAPTRERLSKDMDRALDRALRGGNIAALEQVLDQLDQPLEPSPPPRPVLTYAQPEPQPPSTTPSDPAPLFEQLLQSVALAKTHWSADPSQAQLALETVSQRLGELQAQVSALPKAPPIELPAFRLPWALVIDPPGDVEGAHEVAQHLRLDLASARMHARATYTKIAMRSIDKADLQDRAERYRQALGRSATVLERSDLLACGRAQSALSLAPTWRLSAQELWRLSPDQVPADAGTAQPSQRIELVVPGEVTITTYRSRGLGAAPSPTGERRVLVADLHGPHCFVRVVAGVCELGPSGPSALQRFRSWLERMPARTLASRACVAAEPPHPGPDPRERMEATGWAAFEEHSRAARLLLLSPASAAG